MKNSQIILNTAVILFFLVPVVNLCAQDAAKVDPEHYKVELDNDKVRVLRINYKPGEESKMHSHPEGVVVFMSDTKGKLKTEDGKVLEMDNKKGHVMWTDESKHQPKNSGDKPFEVIQIELKNNHIPAGKKSLHLFDLPEGVSELQLKDFLQEMNQAISEEGYPNAGYHLYKVRDENSSYKYFLEGVWPDAAAYDKIHESEKWKNAAAKGKEMIDKVRANELYLKAEKVN